MTGCVRLVTKGWLPPPAATLDEQAVVAKRNPGRGVNWTHAMFATPPARPDRTASRALLVRPTITLEITPSELFRLIRSLEVEALAAADIGLDDYADFLLRRCAELREAGR